MKKFLFLSAIAVIFAACQSKTEYTISGTVADPMYEGQKVLIVKATDNEMVPVDSTVVANGKFKIKGDTDSAALRFISIGEDASTVRSIMMVEPGKINVVYDSAFHITGTVLNDVYSEFNEKQKEFKKKARSISEQYNNAEVDGTMNDELRTELRSAYDKVAEEEKTMNYEFVKTNISNELGQFMFENMSAMFDAEQQKEILALTSDEYKSKENVKRVVDQLAAMEAVAIGKDFVDFTMKNTKGEYVSLSDYAGKGKYVFIDFWASWCGPCIQEMPNVVNAYEKYKNKDFEIVGVSLDQDEAKWLQGIEELNMTWPQMSDLKLWKSEAVGLYAIRSIPHTVLLDKEGKIIAKDLRGDQLEEKLAELMN